MSKAQADTILSLLRDHGNVLLSGPPGCGKTRLLDEVAIAFEARGSSGPPSTNLKGAVPIPPSTKGSANPNLPSPTKKGQVFKIVFHPGTKPRDFTCDLVPVPNAGGQGLLFAVENGELIKANNLACDSTQNTATLLIIDELNRGPAVQLFGDLMTAIERDKRLDQNNNQLPTSWPFRVRDTSGTPSKMFLSPHFYILAAMNQADTNVEPLDLAFLRRWQSYRLVPDVQAVRDAFQLGAPPQTLPASAASGNDVIEAVIAAWVAVNERIEVGRGAEYQFGHGFFFKAGSPALSLNDSLKSAVEWWTAIETHVLEAFFADPVSQAAALNAGVSQHSYKLAEKTFGLEQRQVLVKPQITDTTIYDVLLKIA